MVAPPRRRLYRHTHVADRAIVQTAACGGGLADGGFGWVIFDGQREPLGSLVVHHIHEGLA